MQNGDRHELLNKQQFILKYLCDPRFCALQLHASLHLPEPRMQLTTERFYSLLNNILLLFRLQLCQKVLVVHKHNLPAIGILYRCDFRFESWEGARFPHNLATQVTRQLLDCFCCLVHILQAAPV
jgi:hypothetical protein